MIKEMEEPTPCLVCGEIYELSDGYCSDKWFPSNSICSDCKMREAAEIEKDEEIQTLREEMEEAEWTIEQAKTRLMELGAERYE